MRRLLPREKQGTNPRFRVGVAAARRRLCSAHKGWRFTVCLAGEKERAGMPGWNGPGPLLAGPFPTPGEKWREHVGHVRRLRCRRASGLVVRAIRSPKAGETNPQ